MKTLKLRKNYEFNYVLKKGNYFSGELIEGFFLKNYKKMNYIGIAISAKTYNAVQRNKIKRIIREAYRHIEEKLLPGNTFVFLWKKKVSIEKCRYSLVLNDMEKIFLKIGCMKNE